MYTRWPMDGLFRHKKRAGNSAARLLLAGLSLALLAGCSLLPQEEEQEALPQIRVPKISQKPEYPVKRETLTLSVSGSGKLMSEREENLYFTVDNQRITDVLVKAGDSVKKGQVLALLDTGDTESQIRRKEIDIEKAELDLKEAIRGSGQGATGNSSDSDVTLRKQKLDYELLESELADLKKDLTGLKLVAPYDGTIVSLTAEKGDLARSYEKVGQIADMNALVVAVQFSSSDLASIAAGMETTVSINTGGEITGKVRRMPISTDQSDEDSLDSYVLIDVPKLPGGVSHGTPLSAAVVVERRENVLTIPVSALRTQNDRNYVMVANADGTKGEVDVEIGSQSTTDVEISKGLVEGQKVVGK
ncbi:macrolide-specific efflux system membrane fusion protein [Paenibacillus taihuensis]|uniref:Macrolide-specific efflux system membrane fusion protein n=1 Tax=Paenibacillus taihuensis TaxID=1156355 RepID=A0A3D9RRY5_9BACL|nr:efflux RND transporter periplasmic adaptor subunit [Paenibacillus taihuensis]REE78734.1 macrolide-specific efflux system membrane fusion protein [Paenibacillus taihuensis]